LPLLMFSVYGANHVNFAMTTNDFAFVANGLDGRSDLHVFLLLLKGARHAPLHFPPPHLRSKLRGGVADATEGLFTVNDATFFFIVGADFQHHTVTWQNADVIAAQFPTDVR
jgi:hypothetical protein